MLGLDDHYMAYCFDEACAYIVAQMEDKQTPHFADEVVDNKGLQLLLA